MSGHRSRRTEHVHDTPSLLDAMGRCRRVVLQAQDSVKPFGVVFHGCGMVTAAMDALAHLLTGHPHYYSIAGSVPASSGSAGSPRSASDGTSLNPDPESKIRPRPAAGPDAASD